MSMERLCASLPVPPRLERSGTIPPKASKTLPFQWNDNTERRGGFSPPSVVPFHYFSILWNAEREL